MIDIITYSDNYQQILKDFFFKPTYELFLKKDFNHIDIIENTNIQNNECLGFGSDIFQHMIYKRWEILINHIENNMDDEKISIFSDIDIVFFDSFKNDIDILFNNNTFHTFFMPEIPFNHSVYDNSKINAGFFIFKHTSTTLNFFRFILEFMKKQKVKEDQFYITQFLQKNRQEFVGLLDYNVFNTNNCNINFNINLRNIKQLKVFHATSCININEKIDVLFKITSNIHNQILPIYDKL